MQYVFEGGHLLPLDALPWFAPFDQSAIFVRHQWNAVSAGSSWRFVKPTRQL